MSRPHIALIAAVARNGVIGRDNTLPWRLRDDLKHFKALTLGHPVIMGRKTWDSLGRPLPGRTNVVLTRQADLTLPGAQCVATLDAALALCRDAEKVFIIGGAQLYALTLARADTLHLTEVHADITGDTHFPAFSTEDFTETARTPHGADAENEYAFDFVDYQRCGRHPT